MIDRQPKYEAFATREVSLDILLERYNQHPVSTLETYKYFNQKGEEADSRKTAFVEASLQGATPDSPGFTYDAIVVEDLIKTRDELTEMLQSLPIDSELDGRGKIIRENITNRLNEIGIMLLSKMQSELSSDDPSYEAISYQLGENMGEVYGIPESEHWRGILGYRLSKLAKIEEMDDASTAVLEAWAHIKEELPTDLPITKPYVPRPETIEWYRGQLDERLASSRQAIKRALDDGVLLLNEDGKLDAVEIVKATNIGLSERGADEWSAVISAESNIDSTQSTKRMNIPEKRMMTLAEFDQIILGHEIDEHVIRRVNGDASGDAVLSGSGANGYLGWEEGNGKANEALIKGSVKSEASAFGFYLSGGLALGIETNGSRGRNFGQTFDLVWRMNYVAAELTGKNSGDVSVDQMAHMTKAVTHLYRLFRGTDGRVPGVILTKDVMTYYLGQADVFRKWDGDMERLTEPERLREHTLERSAKINPLRPDHRAVADAALGNIDL
jgi:hypothetical protein